MTNLPIMLVKGCRLVSCSKPYHLSLKYISALSSHQRNKQPSTFKHGNVFGVEGSSLDTGTATCFGIPEQRHVHQMNNKHGSYAGVVNSDKETRSKPTKSGSRPRYDSAVSSDVFGAPRCRLYHSLGRKVLSGHPLLSTEVVQHNGAKRLSISLKSILDASPPSIQPYLKLIRFDRPIGSYLLFWPCAWSIGIASEAGHFPDFYLLTLFAAGSFFMRGAGCIINDMWDKDFDTKVERTKMRPLACGEISHFQALVFLGSQLGLSLAILLQLNTYSVLLGAASIGLVIAYPLAKRFTNWPQVMLGVTLNWGVLLSWSAIRGSLDATVLPLYLACVLYTFFYDTIYSHQPVLHDWCNKGRGLTFNYGAILGYSAVMGYTDWLVVLPMYAACIAWTLIYDTIYAHQDKYDDMLIGVKSSALALGDRTKPVLTAFATVMVAGLSLTGHLTDQTWPYYTAVVATAAHLFHQLYTVNLDNADECAAKFRSNVQVGAVMFLGVVLGTLLKKPSETGKTDVSDDTEEEK